MDIRDLVRIERFATWYNHDWAKIGMVSSIFDTQHVETEGDDNTDTYDICIKKVIDEVSRLQEERIKKAIQFYVGKGGWIEPIHPWDSFHWDDHKERVDGYHHITSSGRVHVDVDASGCICISIYRPGKYLSSPVLAIASMPEREGDSIDDPIVWDLVDVIGLAYERHWGALRAAMEAFGHGVSVENIPTNQS